MACCFLASRELDVQKLFISLHIILLHLLLIHEMKDFVDVDRSRAIIIEWSSLSVSPAVPKPVLLLNFGQIFVNFLFDLLFSD